MMWVIFSTFVAVEFISVLPKWYVINMIYFYKEKRSINGVKLKATRKYASKG